jgi:hypothetical protein
LYDAKTRGLVIVLANSCQPRFIDLTNNADKGIRTINVRYKSE